jgi:hypothetical protein
MMTTYQFCRHSFVDPEPTPMSANADDDTTKDKLDESQQGVERDYRFLAVCG